MKEEKSTARNIRFEAEIKAYLDARCKREYRTFSNLVNLMLAQQIAAEKRKK